MTGWTKGFFRQSIRVTHQVYINKGSKDAPVD